MLNKMAILKFWLDVFGELMGLGGGLFALQSLAAIKEGTGTFNFQSNCLCALLKTCMHIVFLFD